MSEDLRLTEMTSREHSGGEPAIAYLCDVPALIPIVAAWLFKEWGHRSPGISLERSIGRLEQRARKGVLPSTLTVVQHGHPLGTASLVGKEEMDGAPGPWTSGVYVAPEHRRRGFGNLLIRGVEAEAARRGYTRLLLSAAVPRLYEALGYHATGAWKRDEPIMAKSVTA